MEDKSTQLCIVSFLFLSTAGNISGGSNNHGNDILEPHKGQSLGTHTVILMN